MTHATVSLIIPTYNRRRWIGECLDAIGRQTYRNFEVIVVDDRSTDGTVEWLRGESKYAHVRIHVQEQNGGASIARNTGVQMAAGELITFIDSDDLLEADHLATAAQAFAQYPNLGLFCCDALMIGPEGEVLHNGRTWHEINAEIKNYPVKSGLRSLEEIFLFSNSFPGFTLRREVFDRIGFLDQTIFPLDDYDLALRVAGGGYEVYYCHQPLARYRDHGGNSSGAANQIKVGIEKLRALELALERFPRLRALNFVARGRLGEVMLELAVSHQRAGQYAAAAGMVSKALLTDPSQVRQVSRLLSGRARKLAARETG
jgi:glycosyltransferase involved in cell wall biosynthesis